MVVRRSVVARIRGVPDEIFAISFMMCLCGHTEDEMYKGSGKTKVDLWYVSFQFCNRLTSVYNSMSWPITNIFTSSNMNQTSLLTAPCGWYVRSSFPNQLHAQQRLFLDQDKFHH